MASKREDRREIAVPGFFTCEQAADKLRMKPDTIRRYVHRGVIEHSGYIGNVLLISKAQLEAFRTNRKERGNPNFQRVG